MDESFYKTNWFGSGKRKRFFCHTFFIHNCNCQNQQITKWKSAIRNNLSVFIISICNRIPSQYYTETPNPFGLLSILPDFLYVFYHETKYFTFHVAIKQHKAVCHSKTSRPWLILNHFLLIKLIYYTVLNTIVALINK